MMKLEEAINHCEEVALSCNKSNRECALDHIQLMQWLKELRVIRQLVKPEYLQEIHGLQKTWGKEWEEYFYKALNYDITGPFADANKKDLNQRKAIKFATRLAREKVDCGNKFTTNELINELIKFFMLGVEWADNKIYVE